MRKSEAIKLIDSAFYRLERCCEHTRDWNRFIALIDQEQKDHLQFKPDHVQCGLTRQQSNKLFAVKQVFNRWIPRESGSIYTPEPKDFFSVLKSLYGACAIADSCGDRILQEFPLPEMKHWLESIDYAELNKDPRQQEAA